MAEEQDNNTMDINWDTFYDMYDNLAHFFTLNPIINLIMINGELEGWGKEEVHTLFSSIADSIEDNKEFSKLTPMQKNYVLMIYTLSNLSTEATVLAESEGIESYLELGNKILELMGGDDDGEETTEV